MLEIGFDYYDLDKISLRCVTLNNRSCKITLKEEFRLKI